ncbi:MAG: crossover junction endodeoxyribonuclease RuvC [Gaiellales bacterium]
MIVLGIDPGMADTGFGVVAANGSRLQAVEHGVIGTSADQTPELRLSELQEQVTAVLERHGPESVALEDLYVGANPRTILSVGQARGAILAACGRAGVPVESYAPAQIKAAVCGFGRADKGQVTRMVSAILGIDGRGPGGHAADALAAAVCHAQMSRTRNLRVAAR